MRNFVTLSLLTGAGGDVPPGYPNPTGKTRECLEKLSSAQVFIGEDLLQGHNVHWLHYKGGRYLITGFQIDTNDGTVRVSYRRVAGEGFQPPYDRLIEFSRPLGEWRELVEWPDGTKRARFMPVGPVTKVDFLDEANRGDMSIVDLGGHTVETKPQSFSS